jgi:hypothetical protein
MRKINLLDDNLENYPLLIKTEITSKKRYRIYFICKNCNKKINILLKVRIKYFEFICGRCKSKQTCLNMYGVDNPAKSDIIKEKVKQKCLNKYGVEYSLQSKFVRDKGKQTCLDRYGVDSSNKDKKIKNKIKQTFLKRYGVNSFSKTEEYKSKCKNTCIKNYGVDNYSKTDEYKNRMKLQSNEIRQKVYLTKKKNNSFHTSKPEEKVFELLKEKYGNVIRQYKNFRYPFCCDFYIPEKDLFIELNLFWSHGKKPFENTKEDLEKLNKWKNKNTKFYNNAIGIWTIKDIYKRQIAKQNNLNYLEFFNFNEFISWFKEDK